ncbi:MAG: IS1380 family transposase [Planctomycetota bacterium]
MDNHTTEQGVMFTGLSKRPVHVRFDQAHATSDGGAILLKAVDEKLGLSAALASSLRDCRQPNKIRHSLTELVRQRLYAIACGYADGNDAARLAHDPIFKLLLNRDPINDDALASQPTLSRFEASVGPRDIMRLSRTLAECVIERHRRRTSGRVKRITIDLDPTDDATHGNQQLSLFNAVYDSWCYLPLAGFLSFDNEPQQYLFCYLLRDGHAPAKRGCLAVLKRLLPRLRQAFPQATVRIRLDAGFTGAELYEFFEAERLEYIVCMSKNPVLERFAKPLMEPIREALARNETCACAYGEARYRARSWNRERRVIIRADVVHQPGRQPKDNPRFLITNIRGWPKQLYEQVYCGRCDAENRIKELKLGLHIDRTSCSRFHANQLRVLLTSAAYVLMQELRLRARHTDSATAQVSSLQLRLMKISASLEASTRRIVMHMPTYMVYRKDWLRIAQSVGAVPT